MICYLVLAHASPNHFARHIDALTCGGNRAVVHVDAKTNIDPFRGANPAATFVEDRVRVNWGGFSIVEATLRMMRAAVAAVPDADWYALTSGDAYPLRDQGAIEEFLNSDGGAAYMSILPMPSPGVDKPLRRLSGYYIEHDPRTTKASAFYKAVHRLIHRNYGRALGGMRPYAGSQWAVWRADVVRYLIEQVDTRPGFVEFCRNTHIPDEHFFQILLGNSPFADAVRPGVMYSDFSRTSGGPAILGDGHVERWRTSPLTWSSAYGHHELLFARKFPDDSADLVARVQRQVWQVPQLRRTSRYRES